ncbi:MAG TPA: nucleotidyltransferase domain-containing protein [Candidatus Babeliales bacterium]|nr:nucleotidyltransferase domain-containing protein [Candidatus Babeliales bacterium]
MIDSKRQALIIRVLVALLPNVKIYLFGSRARGTNREASDIDLALDLGREMTLRELSLARNVLGELYIPQKIDVVDLNSVSQDLKNTILSEGILWQS